MSILSGFRLWLPAAFAHSGCFRRDCGMDAHVVEIGVMIPPAVVRLFGDLTGSQPGRLFLPCTKTLLQIGRMDAAIKISARRQIRPSALVIRRSFRSSKAKSVCINRPWYQCPARRWPWEKRPALPPSARSALPWAFDPQIHTEQVSHQPSSLETPEEDPNTFVSSPVKCERNGYVRRLPSNHLLNRIIYHSKSV